jgi:hypothetical protein
MCFLSIPAIICWYKPTKACIIDNAVIVSLVGALTSMTFHAIFALGRVPIDESFHYQISRC